jgi:hypothetical protein
MDLSWLWEVMEGLNNMLHEPFCMKTCEHDGVCSLLRGHGGEHMACGSGAEIYCVWEEEGEHSSWTCY